MLYRFGLLASSLLICFVLLEVALRLFAAGDNLRVTATADYYRPHESRGYTLQSDVRTATYWGGQQLIRITTNSAGRRVPDDADFVEIRGRRQLVLCGDSYVFGNEVNAEDSFTYVIRELSDYDTINLGVGGYGTWHALDAWREFVEVEGTSLVDFVLLFFFVGNDFSDNTRSMTYYSVDENGRLLRDGVSERLLLRRLVYTSHALTFIYVRAKPLISRMTRPDADVSEAHIYSDAFYTDELLDANRKALADFRDFTRSEGLRFAVVVVPVKDQLDRDFESEDDRVRPNRVLARLLDELGIPYLDLLPHLERRPDESLYNAIPAGHFSINGNRVVARIIIDFLDRTGREQTGNR